MLSPFSIFIICQNFTIFLSTSPIISSKHRARQQSTSIEPFARAAAAALPTLPGRLIVLGFRGVASFRCQYTIKVNLGCI